MAEADLLNRATREEEIQWDPRLLISVILNNSADPISSNPLKDEVRINSVVRCNKEVKVFHK
jgi:hypothetical protein